jgi:hypothetical protein
MLKNILRTGTVAAALAVVPSLVVAQQPTPAPAPADSAAPQAPQAAPADTGSPAELQQVSAQLEAIQARAMQDPQIQAANAELTAVVTAAIEKSDPNAHAALERAKTIKADVAAAQAAQDNDKLQALATEAQQLQQTVSAAQQKAMADPEVQKKMGDFKTQLFKKMVEIDPQAQQLVARLSALQNKQP